MDPTSSTARRRTRAALLLAGGAVAGVVLAGTLTANAASSGSTSTASPGAGYGTAAPRGNVDESKSQRPDEHLLTGTTAEKVRAAALAKYPGATILRVETDSDGVYEAHLVTSAGARVTVEVGKDFTVTGLEQMPAGGPGGNGGAPSSGSPSSSSTRGSA